MKNFEITAITKMVTWTTYRMLHSGEREAKKTGIKLIRKHWTYCLVASLLITGGAAFLLGTLYTIFTYWKSAAVSSDFFVDHESDRFDSYHRDSQTDSQPLVVNTRVRWQSRNVERNTNFSIGERENVDANISQIIVCYYTISIDTNSSSSLEPWDIGARLCTHIIVGFAAVVDSVISLGNSSYIYESVARLKDSNPDLKVMISAGGMNEVDGGFPQMVRTPGNRQRFIRSVVRATSALNLDGLDLDWEFPAWMGGDARQRMYFAQLLRELRNEFDRSSKKLLLSVAVAAPITIIDQSYDIPKIAQYVDFVCLMSYDYHIYKWYMPITGHNAPLYPRSEEKNYVATLNVNYSTMYWLAMGMPRSKMVVGIPTYGRSYELDNPVNHDVSAPAKGFGKLGEDGFVTYPDVCSFLKFGATRRFDRQSEVPYAYKQKEWVSYEDPVSVEKKAKWIKEHRLKGAMIFSLNQDDWNASCVGPNENGDKFPLTRIVGKILLGTNVD